jgi:hypothetical protein
MERARAYIANKKEEELRAAQLVKKQKEEEEQRNKVKELVVCDWLEYGTISKKNQEDMAATKRSGTEANRPELGSFIDPADGRLVVTGMRIFRGNRSVVTTSFDGRTLRCRGCSGHEDKSPWRSNRGQVGNRQVFLLTDQCYPPV